MRSFMPGVPAEKAGGHWDRVAAMVAKFREATGSKAPVFGAVDVGADPYWWDYGQIRYFYDNNCKITGCVPAVVVLA